MSNPRSTAYRDAVAQFKDTEIVRCGICRVKDFTRKDAAFYDDGSGKRVCDKCWNDKCAHNASIAIFLIMKESESTA
ncbi:hypothetical protein KW785_00200 [Candidatus Parcubacteria bacterium]|nr:hypothetical protein [Candidatus Parcubacteria bacterium]